MSAKSTDTIIRSSDWIACQSNGNKEGTGFGSLYYRRKDLYRHRPTGKMFFSETVGGGIQGDHRTPVWVSEDEALEWLTNHAADTLTGFGYTDEGAKDLLAGIQTAHKAGLKTDG